MRRHSPSILTLFLLVIGGSLVLTYAFVPENRITAPHQGLGVAMTNGVKLNQLVLGLSPEASPPLLELDGWWSFQGDVQSHESAYLMFVLPFVVEVEVVVVGLSKPLNWTYVSNQTIAASVVYSMISNDTTKTQGGVFYVRFYVAKTFEASKRGVSTVVLPLELGVGGTDFPAVDELERKLGIGFYSPPAQTFDVYVGLPLSADQIQGFPEPTSRTPYANFYNPKGGNSVHWTLTQRQTVTLSYVDRETISYYDASVIIGSLALGTALSGVLDWLKEISREVT
jgi:hypothetical protein